MSDLLKETAWLLKEKYGGRKAQGYFIDLKRLEDGEPLAYIIGHTPFLNTTIYLESRPLIPRAETEFWVEQAINEIRERAKHSKEKVRVLDLCAGSGCIGIAALKALPNVTVDFEELDERHHPTIRMNLKVNNLPVSKSAIYEGDLLSNVNGTYDFILTNPPYIDEKAHTVAPSVKLYEPKNALYGGSKGVEIVERIVKGSREHLTKAGVLFIEHEPKHKKHIHELAKKCGFTAKTYKDQYKKDRFTILSRKLE